MTTLLRPPQNSSIYRGTIDQGPGIDNRGAHTH